MSVLLVLFVLVSPIYGQNTGDIRLVGGSYQWEGRVEIYYSETWGRVTDSDWTNTEAQVVCRKLGHFKPGTIAFSNAYFGEGSGSYHLLSVNCSGSEYSLTECETKHSGAGNSHSLPVGVKCKPADEAYREGDIRLVGGAYDWEGRVEIYWMGQWGTVSDSSWTTEDASVVCRQLRHATGSGVPIPCCDEYGEGVGDIHVHGVVCNGTEENITSCTLYFNDTADTSHQQDVRIQCQQGNEVKEGDIRLIGSSNFAREYVYRRVEIFLSGVWGTISYDGSYRQTFEAKVVCRQLGYNAYRVSYACCAHSGQGTGPIHFGYLQCNGLEHRLTDCQYSTNTLGRRHYDDWSVFCYTDGIEPGDVAIAIHVEPSGFVQVFLSGVLAPVANSNLTWTRDNSEVVCRELGYAPNDTTWYPLTWFNPPYQQVDNVVCTGTEPQLTDCSFNVTSTDTSTAVKVSCEYNNCSDGDVRLAGGETETEGRLEICSNRKWGTVCDNQWTVNHTAVVCRHLGFSDAIGDSAYFTSERFGRGTGPVLIDYVHCTGSEPRIWGHCTHFTHYYGCTHEDDVGVRCQPVCTDGQIRLIEGSHAHSGCVEICSHQRWETLNYNQWTYSAATVVCNELGFHYVVNNWRTRCGRGGGPMHQKYYQCTGTEFRLSECSSYNDTAVRTHYDDVGIYCYSGLASCGEWELRLVEGKTELEGRLEVCFNRRWGTVASERWSQSNSQVYCNSYGYDATEEVTGVRSIPQSLSKPVHIHNVICQPTALTLDKCSHDRYSGNSNSVTDVIIICQYVSCSDGDLKLVGGSVVSAGRLQICFNKRWSTINGDRWREQYTKVACKQLGYPTEGAKYFTRSRQSSENIPVVITDVTCYGTEEKLIDCDYHDYTGILSASHDVYISCSRDQIPAPTNATTFITTGTEIPVSTDNEGDYTGSPAASQDLHISSTTDQIPAATNDTTLITTGSKIPVSTDYEGDNNGSQTINIVIACSVTVVLCFSMFFGLVTGYLCIIQKKKDRENVDPGNRTQAGGEGENVTTVYSDNVSYIPSTGLTNSSKGANSTDDKSVPSVRDDSTLTGGEGQNVTTVYTYSDNVSYIPSTGLTKSSKGANSTDDKSVPSVRDDSTLPHQQQLPPIPLETVTQSCVMVDPIYDTCQ